MATESRNQSDASGSIGTMKQESNRLLSYRNWPVRFIQPEDLAKAGFFYTENDDCVRCAFCNIVLNRWEEGDDPMEDHRKWSPNCNFVKGREGRNMAYPVDRVPPVASNEILGRSAIQIMPNSVPEQENFRPPSTGSYGLPHHGGPVYGEYSSSAKRLESFRNWPTESRITPEQLAAAGFFHQGLGDRTVCFYCGGGLHNWERDDDPWEEHSKWFPKCSFVLMQKGQQFVSQAQNGLGNSESSQEEAAAVEVPSNSGTNLKEDKKDPICNTCKICKICYIKEVEIAFIPCGHLVACVDCTMALTVCPFCRVPIRSTLRIFTI